MRTRAPKGTEEKEIVDKLADHLAHFACIGIRNLIGATVEPPTNYDDLDNIRVSASTDYLCSSGILDASERAVDTIAGEDDKACVVCEENVAIMLYLPCRHVVNCSRCSKLLNECPTCRSDIDHKIHVYT